MRLIGLQMCFYGAMKQYSWLSPSCENLQFHKIIVFLFVKTEKKNSIKEIKHVLCVFIAWRKPRQSL